MNKKEALDITGGLSRTSKMPGHSYSIPARECKVGARLVGVKGSICSACYAFRGNYTRPAVRAAMERRFASLHDPRWTEAMTVAIASTDRCGYFRWHDSGDLQGVWHLGNICDVARGTPGIGHWLPTKEHATVDAYVKGGGIIPDNMVVRMSAMMIDEVPAGRSSKMGLSGVGTSLYNCRATPGRGCGECRMCWDRDVETVIYKKH